MIESFFGTVIAVFFILLLAIFIFWLGGQYQKHRFYNADDRQDYDCYGKWDRAHKYKTFDLEPFWVRKKLEKTEEAQWKQGFERGHQPKHTKR